MTNILGNYCGVCLALPCKCHEKIEKFTKTRKHPEKLDREWFSADIKSKRRSRKLNLREAAKQIGVSTATLSRLENEKEPDINSYFLACKWLEFPMEKYFADVIPAGGFRSAACR